MVCSMLWPQARCLGVFTIIISREIPTKLCIRLAVPIWGCHVHMKLLVLLLLLLLSLRVLPCSFCDAVLSCCLHVLLAFCQPFCVLSFADFCIKLIACLLRNSFVILISFVRATVR